MLLWVPVTIPHHHGDHLHSVNQACLDLFIFFSYHLSSSHLKDNACLLLDLILNRGLCCIHFSKKVSIFD